MSQFIFDQIYGSQAKRKRIMQNNNFLYYRQMMKIKNSHLKNKSLYQHLYKVPTQIETSSPYPSRKAINESLFLTMNQDNYAVQKINSHAFKIMKRKGKSTPKPTQQANIKNWAAEKGYRLDSNRKLTSRTIDSDAKRLKDYLILSRQQANRPDKRIRNISVQLGTSIKNHFKFIKTQCSTTPFPITNN